MDAGVEATQEQSPDVPPKSPAPTHGLPGQDAQEAPKGVAFLLGCFLFTPGILLSALRASFAVRMRILLMRGHSKRK
jgi:hypothetical protein